VHGGTNDEGLVDNNVHLLELDETCSKKYEWMIIP